jgi:MoaE-MoaD fusion protein
VVDNFNRDVTVMDFPTIICVTEKPIDQDSFVAGITLPTAGAAVVFSGIVRSQDDHGAGKVVRFLDYEAYLPMAEEKLRQVATEIREKWGLIQGIAIVQRLGHIEAGSTSTLIACTAAHRDSGVFDAVRYGIDRVKEIVPVWKKEIGEDGEAWVEGHYFPKPGE